MAVYFLYMKTFGRGNGGSAPSAIAYRSGERIKDERTGRTYDHSGRQDVVHKEIVLPQKFNDSDMGWAKDRAALWNAAEAMEPRKNARVAREVLIALPAEMNDAQRLDLVRGFARDLVERYGFAIDFAIHAPLQFYDRARRAQLSRRALACGASGACAGACGTLGCAGGCRIAAARLA